MLKLRMRQKIKLRASRNRRTGLSIVLFSIMGVAGVLLANAQGAPIFVFEAETSDRDNLAAKSDSNASGGCYVEFNEVADETWGGYVKPGAHNTGHDGNLTKAYSGTTDINDAWLNSNNGGSRVIENVRFNGRVNVWANNVTIRNFLVDGGLYGIYNGVFEGHIVSGLVLEDGELINQENSGIVVSNAIVKRLHAHHQGADAFKPYRNVIIESSYAHHLGNKAPDVHADGIQMVSGINCIFRGNNFDMKHDEPGFTNSQVMIIQTNVGIIDDILIEYNWINGGGYSVQIRDKGTGFGAPTNVRLLNNRFGREYQFGLLIMHEGEGNQVKGNVWDDTSELAPINDF